MLGEALERCADVAEGPRGVVDRVELVDRKDHRGNAKQVGQQGVAAGLGQQGQAGVLPGELGGVNQYHRSISAGRSGDHVAGVLLMARRIADDEFARRRGEVAVGHVDGDALFAFSRQAVGEKREVGLARARNAGQLVLQHGATIDQEPTDQGALAVIDAAAGDQAKGGFCHQK